MVFENTHKKTNIRHNLSEHAGMPVIKGKKWAFNLWFREGDVKKIYNYEVTNKETNNENIKIDNKIKLYNNILTNNDVLKIINCCSFEEKEQSSVWIENNKIMNIIKKLEAIVKIDKIYFETMCVTKYAPGINHNEHPDAFDIKDKKGKEYMSLLGQRLVTITGALTNFKITFSKLGKIYDMNKNEILIYNNCYSNSNKRDLNMMKTYTPVDKHSGMIVFNIYIREKDLQNTKLLKISNTITETKIENNLSTNELIHLIYKYSKNTNIPGFNVANIAPIDYVMKTLLKIKTIKNKINNAFLNPLNIEKTKLYAFDEYNPVVVEDVINKDIHQIVNEYFKTNIKNKIYIFGDIQSKRYKYNDEIITRLLHLEFLPLIEKIVGKKVKPTYTYLSAYIKGADLPAHTDRPECEYTCSYIIGKPQNTNWNIYVHKKKREKKYEGKMNFTPPKEECVAVDCNENGLMIFKGTDHPHYREPLEHEYYNIVLLHYCSK